MLPGTFIEFPLIAVLARVATFILGPRAGVVGTGQEHSGKRHLRARRRPGEIVLACFARMTAYR